MSWIVLIILLVLILAAVPTWPFDLSILSRLGVMVLPIVVGLVTQLVANLLGL